MNIVQEPEAVRGQCGISELSYGLLDRTIDHSAADTIATLLNTASSYPLYPPLALDMLLDCLPITAYVFIHAT